MATIVLVDAAAAVLRATRRMLAPHAELLLAPDGERALAIPPPDSFVPVPYQHSPGDIAFDEAMLARPEYWFGVEDAQAMLRHGADTENDFARWTSPFIERWARERLPVVWPDLDFETTQIGIPSVVVERVRKMRG